MKSEVRWKCAGCGHENWAHRWKCRCERQRWESLGISEEDAKRMCLKIYAIHYPERSAFLDKRNNHNKLVDTHQQHR